jgi:DNA repair protein RAD50
LLFHAGEVEVLKEAAKKAKAAAAATRGNQSGGGGSAPRDLPVLEQEKSKLLTDRAENKGKAETMKRQMHDLTTRLKEPNYRGVRERARTKRIEVETTAMACEDLERYWTALDKALLR